MSYDVGRKALRDLLVGAVLAAHPGAGADEHIVAERAVRSSPSLAAALDRLWPSVSPPALVRALVTKKTTLARAAAGVLTPGEQAAVLRKATPTEALEARSTEMALPAWELRRRQASARAAPAGGATGAGGRARPKLRGPWTAAEVALLDEAVALVTGEGRTYGHIVVDEAQDLSPMQLRMVARRSPAGSVTMLGDLAQASGPWAPATWQEVTEHLATPAGSRLAELGLGYGHRLMSSSWRPGSFPSPRRTAPRRDQSGPAAAG